MLVALGREFVRAKRCVRRFRGSSQPTLVQASDGLHYIVKFNNRQQRPNLPFNESVGSEMYRACRLAVPSWKPILVTDSFLEQNPDCWMQTPEGRLRPEPGLCFGSRFLGDDSIRLLEILPEAYFKRVRNRASFWLAWLIDICAEKVDNRQAVFVDNASGWLEAFFIDHGNLFNGPKADKVTHFCVSRYLDLRVYPDVSSKEILEFQRILSSLDTDKLWQTVQGIPADWRQASALDSFACCLDSLSNPVLIRNVLEAMIDGRTTRTESEPGGCRSKCELQGKVLRLGIQGTWLQRLRGRHSACA